MSFLATWPQTSKSWGWFPANSQQVLTRNESKSRCFPVSRWKLSLDDTLFQPCDTLNRESSYAMLVYFPNLFYWNNFHCITRKYACKIHKTSMNFSQRIDWSDRLCKPNFTFGNFILNCKVKWADRMFFEVAFICLLFMLYIFRFSEDKMLHSCEEIHTFPPPDTVTGLMMLWSSTILHMI